MWLLMLMLMLMPQLAPPLCHHTNIALSQCEKSERIPMLYFCCFAWWRLLDGNWHLWLPACLPACLPVGLLVGSWLWSASSYRFVAALSLIPSSAVMIVAVCCCCSTFHYLLKYTFISFECFSVGSHLAHGNNKSNSINFCSLIPQCVCTWMSCGCALNDIYSFTALLFSCFCCCYCCCWWWRWRWRWLLVPFLMWLMLIVIFPPSQRHTFVYYAHATCCKQYNGFFFRLTVVCSTKIYTK